MDTQCKVTHGNREAIGQCSSGVKDGISSCFERLEDGIGLSNFQFESDTDVPQVGENASISIVRKLKNGKYYKISVSGEITGISLAETKSISKNSTSESSGEKCC